jgi:hypothetical protein
LRADTIINENFENTLDPSMVISHVKYFSNFSAIGSRVTGYSGCKASAKYIENFFNTLGLQVLVQKYGLAAPIDPSNTSVIILSPTEYANHSIKAYTLWPNSVQTSPIPSEGMDGTLIYVGTGEFEQFDGKKVEGAIVLMDFDSQQNWLNAAKLGAKAVIFIEPTETQYEDCMAKFLDTPINFPRLYVSQSDGQFLKRMSQENDSRVKIVSRMLYRETEAENVIGVVTGKTLPNDVIIVAAHYDDWSVVPGISYGANDAVSIATLLELAKYFAQNQPSATMWFVALSGHWEAIAGAREFVETYYFKENVTSGQYRPFMFINLDLTADGLGLSILASGDYSGYGATNTVRSNVAQRLSFAVNNIPIIAQQIDEVISSLTGISANDFINGDPITGLAWYGTYSHPYMLDSEAPFIAGNKAFSLSTANTYRQWEGSPLNDLNYAITNINGKNFKAQLVAVMAFINYYANLPNFETEILWYETAPTRWEVVGGQSGGMIGRSAGFVRLYGQVQSYNFSKNNYSPVPNAIVRVFIGIGPGFEYQLSKIVTFADENGSFIVHGISPSVAIPPMGGVYSTAQAAGGEVRVAWSFNAWKINETNGEIIYAPDAGIFGSSIVAPLVSPQNEPVFGTAIVGKFTSITLFDLFNPYLQRNIKISDPRLGGFYAAFWQAYGLDPGGFWVNGVAALTPVEFYTQTLPLVYGVYFNGWDPVGMVFLRPNMTYALLFKSGSPFMVLTNSSETVPEGNGFFIGKKPLIINMTVVQAANDLYWISKSRYDRLSKQNVRKLSTEDILDYAGSLLDQTGSDLKNMLYSKAYNEADVSWSNIVKAYNQEVMPLIGDTSRMSLILFALILPTAFFIERLVYHGKGRRQFISVVITVIAFLAVFSQVNPAFNLMSNASIGLLGVTAVILCGITIVFILQIVEKLTTEIEYKRLGTHRIESGRMSTLGVSFSIAPENMRKRRFRTLLTLTTITITAIALTSLTSVSPYTDVKFAPPEAKLTAAQTYDGILIKMGWAYPEGCLSPYMLYEIRGVVGHNASIQPRVFYYAPTVASEIVSTFAVSEFNKTAIQAAFGMTETDVQRYETISIGPILPETKYSCILPKTIANYLNVSLGDEIEVFGFRLFIRGIIDDSMVSSVNYDLDGRQITPIDPIFVGSLVFQAAPGAATGLDYSRGVIIIPYELAINLRGYVSSISISFPNGITQTELFEYARRFSLGTSVEVYVSYDGNVYKCTQVQTYLYSGWETLIPLLLIASLNVAVTLIGSVRERTRDVFIFSSVGLSPMGASIMFVVEASIYSLISTSLGYFLGLGINAILIQTGFLTGEQLFNFSSIFVPVALATLMTAALGSSIYPAIVAARIITPSLKRKWELTTKPIGDEWNIPLPVSFPEENEIYGVLEYLSEYYAGSGTAKDRFMISDTNPVNMKEMKLELKVELAPFEKGITQYVVLSFTKETEIASRYVFNIYLRHLTGERSAWIHSSYAYIDDVRKQLLLWRALNEENRRAYIKKAMSSG